jgi:hypothetical protein
MHSGNWQAKKPHNEQLVSAGAAAFAQLFELQFGRPTWKVQTLLRQAFHWFVKNANKLQARLQRSAS